MIRFSRSLKVIPGAEEANKVKHREEGKESSGKAETAPLDTMMKVHVCSAAPVLHDSLRSHELQLTRLLCPWDSPGRRLEWAAMPGFSFSGYLFRFGKHLSDMSESQRLAQRKGVTNKLQEKKAGLLCTISCANIPCHLLSAPQKIGLQDTNTQGTQSQGLYSPANLILLPETWGECLGVLSKIHHSTTSHMPGLLLFVFFF